MPVFEIHLDVKANIKIRNKAIHTLKTKQPFMLLFLFYFIKVFLICILGNIKAVLNVYVYIMKWEHELKQLAKYWFRRYTHFPLLCDKLLQI